MFFFLLFINIVSIMKAMIISLNCIQYVKYIIMILLRYAQTQNNKKKKNDSDKKNIDLKKTAHE